MSREFRPPVDGKFYSTGIVADCVDWSEGYILRTTDAPNEFVWVMPDKPDTYARLSIKFEDVKDVYRSTTINPTSRVDDVSGTRVSVAYSEICEEYDMADATYRRLAPLTMTTNMTIPHVSAMDAEDIAAFVARAVGAWLGLDKDVEATSEIKTYGGDVISRLFGSLKPANFEG
jgi:hypothetical protein